MQMSCEYGAIGDFLSSLQNIKISFPDCREFWETIGTND
jgi:hypothetical protein